MTKTPKARKRRLNQGTVGSGQGLHTSDPAYRLWLEQQRRAIEESTNPRPPSNESNRLFPPSVAPD